jgi:hypothetical protein
MHLTPTKACKIIAYEHNRLTQRQIAEQCDVSLGAFNKNIRLKSDTGLAFSKEVAMCAVKENNLER